MTVVAQDRPKTTLSFVTHVIGFVMVVSAVVSAFTWIFLRSPPYEERYVGGWHSYGAAGNTWCQDFDVRADLRAQDPTCRVVLCTVEGSLVEDKKTLPPVVLFCRGGDATWKR